ncbi:MAG: MBL fold metallo-hydrolase [Bacteroidetes bacterium]|nr:MBL fold metallo-hydrolase [Bacteroidota bacterium]
MITEEDLKLDVSTLSTWLAEKRPVTVLDVRPVKEREEWKIPGSIHADVYDKLKANDQTAFDNIKLDSRNPIVTVCAAGKTSMKAALILKAKGFDAFSLDGGMKAWNFAWNKAETTIHDVKVIQIRRSSKGCLSYMIGSEDEALVIDASLAPQVYIDFARENGWSIKYVTDTHIHADYLSRTRELAEAASAEHILIDKANVGYGFWPIKNEELIEFGNAKLKVIHTPGHTLESTSFQLRDEVIFTGDTLFVDGVGRPDLKANQEEAKEKSRMLFHSLQRIMSLNSNMWVFPAHFSHAVPFDDNLVTETIGGLKDKLKMLSLSEDEFIEFTMKRIPPTPPNYLMIATLNKQGSYEGHSPLELEAGANRCAIE